MLTFKQKLKLCGFAAGIIGCFTAFGLAQEKVFRGRFGEELDPKDNEIGERYRMPVTIGLIQGLVHASLARGQLIIF